jgi:adenylate cyclase
MLCAMSDSEVPQLAIPQEIRALRAAKRTIERLVPCRHSAEELWPYITQIDLFNRAAGASAADYEIIPLPDSASAIRATSRKMGLRMRHQELPYEWLKPQFVQGEMIFDSGPLLYGRIRAEYLEEQSAVRYTVDYVPRRRFGFAPLVARGILAKYVKILRGIDERLPPSIDDPLGAEGFADRSATALQRAQRLARQWRHLATDALVPDSLAEFIATAPDRLVARIRPYAVAAQLGTARREMLEFCLRAARAGFLELSWDLICPSCDGAKRRAPTLADLGPEAHCDVCNIRYDADLARNVEVSFRPAAEIRKPDDREFCIQSPSNQRQILAQLNVEPLTTKRLRLSLQPGHYRLRCIGREGELMFDSAYGRPQGEAAVQLGARIGVESRSCGSELDLVLENDGEAWRTVRFEHHGYREDAATAAEVVNTPEYLECHGADPSFALALQS